jgi:hypothetical protein
MTEVFFDCSVRYVTIILVATVPGGKNLGVLVVMVGHSGDSVGDGVTVGGWYAPWRYCCVPSQRLVTYLTAGVMACAVMWRGVMCRNAW